MLNIQDMIEWNVFYTETKEQQLHKTDANMYEVTMDSQFYQ